MRQFNVLILILGLIYNTIAQEKIASIGLGMKFKKTESTNYQFSFAFNRIPAVDEDAGPSLKVFQIGKKTLFSLRPSSEVDVGNAVDVSPNNIFFDLQLEGLTPLKKTTHLLYNISPTVTADKNFETGLIYSTFGINVIYYNYPSDNAFYILPGINFDIIQRVFKVSKPTFVTRFGCNLIFNIKIKNYISFTVKSQLFNINNDTAVVKNGMYGNLISAIDYKFQFYEKLGLSVKYILGHFEPFYKKLNTLVIGLSLFK